MRTTTTIALACVAALSGSNAHGGAASRDAIARERAPRPDPVATRSREDAGRPIERTEPRRDDARERARQVECIASAMWHEARNQPVEGRVAVAEVILGRVGETRYPDTPCDVVAQRDQFSFVRRGVIPAMPPRDAPAMRRLALEVVAGRLVSAVRGALFFHEAHARPGWNLRRIGRIGDHVFYRDRI